MNIKILLELNFGKEENSEHTVQEQKEEKKTSNICQLRDSTDECVEQDTKILVLFDDLENATDSEGSNNCCKGANV